MVDVTERIIEMEDFSMNEKDYWAVAKTVSFKEGLTSAAIQFFKALNLVYSTGFPRPPCHDEVPASVYFTRVSSWAPSTSASN